MRVHLCKTFSFPWYFPMSPTSSPWVLILVPFKKGCCCHLTSKYQRLSEDVAWPRSHSIIEAGTGTSCLASLGTEGGDQFDSFDSSFLEVRTMFCFWKEYFVLFNSNLPQRQILYSSADKFDLLSVQYLHLFNTFHSVLEAISTPETGPCYLVYICNVVKAISIRVIIRCRWL